LPSSSRQFECEKHLKVKDLIEEHPATGLHYPPLILAHKSASWVCRSRLYETSPLLANAGMMTGIWVARLMPSQNREQLGQKNWRPDQHLAKKSPDLAALFSKAKSLCTWRD
jgi:hypothetical protein